MKRLTTGTIVVALLGLSSQGNADTISMNFVENPGNQIFAGGEMIGPLATDSSYWNHNTIPTTGDYTAGTLTGLMDGTGAATAVDVQWLCSNTWYNGDGTGDDEHKLSVGYLDDGDSGNGQGVTVTLSNIPYATYRIYGLFASDYATDVVNYNVNGTWALGGDSTTIASAFGKIDDNFTANGEYWTEIDPGVVQGNYWTVDASGATCVLTGETRNGSARGCLTAVIIEELQSGPGTQYCPGDGVGTSCGCGNNNDGSMSGCDWQNAGGGAAGAVLDATGSDMMASNDTFLVATNVSGNTGVFFSANGEVTGRTLGDGIRCAGHGLIRMTLPIAPGGSSDTHTVPLQTLDPLAAPGVTRYYQYWFRTSPGACGSDTSNTTNGYSIAWM